MLASIAIAPTDQTQSHFDFAHYNDHLEILQAINSQQATNLPPRAIYPTPDVTSDAWKRMHQSMHDDMNKALGLNSQNLLGQVDGLWHNQNYQEHQAARAALGI